MNGCCISGWPLRMEAISTGSNSTISKIVRIVTPLQRLPDAIAGPFVYCIMTTFAFWYRVYVLLDDIAGPDGDPLFVMLVFFSQVVSCPCALRLNMPTAVLVGIV
ncbi:hypothetical protein GOBAR_AA18092 [Gossypium barbadense]|uniref:Uncharacterized protein n=1 Tax=Gossypium barbadense TaxID=3634 RepID=A0A2P5XGW1_GOSBA|nr:hypothetical protein GOBAR_AA18092 [Gossypium barbadense]